MATVLEGEVTLRENGSDEQTFAANEGWTMQPGQRYAAGNDTGATARLVLSFLLPEGADLTTVHE